MTGAQLSSGTWLLQEASAAAVRLACLPHAGAGAASFTRWLGLSPPAIAFYGIEDTVVDVDEVAAWESQTEATFAMHAMPGDHFFHQRHGVPVVANIAEKLT